VFEYARGVAVDASGNIVVIGGFYGSIDLGGGPLASQGGYDALVAKYSPSGAHVWSRGLGGTADDYGYGVATDSAGDVVVTGYFQNTADFGTGPLASAGASDVFVAEYSPAGAPRWARRAGGSGSEDGRAIAADRDGNVLVTGTFQGSVDFGGGPLTSNGSRDLFVARYSPSGVHLSSRRYGGVTGEQSCAVAADPTGNPILAGYLQGTVDFGQGPLTAAGDRDVFLTRLLP